MDEMLEEESSLSVSDIKELRRKKYKVEKVTSTKFDEPSYYIIKDKKYDVLEDLVRIQHVAEMIEEVSSKEYIDRIKFDKKTRKHLESLGYMVFLNDEGGNRVYNKFENIAN